MKWTDSAQGDFQNFLAQLERTSGPYARERMRKEIEKELRLSEVKTIDSEFLQQYLSDKFSWYKGPDPSLDQAMALKKNQFQSFASSFIVIMGVAFPLITILLELCTGMCKGTFFDPYPSFWHIPFTFIVPISNLMMFLAIQNHKTFSAKQLALNGVAICFAFYFSAFLVPLVPFFLIAIIFFGFGLLPCSVICSFFAAWMLRVRYKKIHQEPKPSWTHFKYAFMVCFLALGLVNGPRIFTDHAIRRYLEADNSTEKKEAVTFIRRFTTNSGLRDGLFDSNRSSSSLFGNDFRNHVSSSEAREIYYRITGEFHDGHSSHFRNRDTWDNQLGEQMNHGKRKGLSLQSSQFNSSIDIPGKVSYSEWTMVFHNHGDFWQEEARFDLLLPQDSVVSRLTLWVNGEEREAAFAKESQVVSAYKKVVSRRRDPVLVTYAGQDRVFVQCFPVQKGETMKIRLGITSAILPHKSLNQAQFDLPQIVNENFNIKPELKHHIWLESKHALEAQKNSNLKLSYDKAYRLNGDIQHKDLPEAAIAKIKTDRDNWSSWTKNNGTFIQQDLSSEDFNDKLIIVLDGSQSLAPFYEKIKTALQAIQPKIQRIIIAGETLREIRHVEELTEDDFQYVGDNISALKLALNEQQAKESILWVSGSRPYLIGPSEALYQQIHRRPLNKAIFHCQLTAGSNRILKEFKKEDLFQNIAWDNEDSFQVFNDLQYSFKRNYADSTSLRGKETSKHIARLWVKDLINSKRKQTQTRDELVQLGRDYQVVTRLTGAVVLENQQQYAESGLDDVDTDTVPTVPEPETYAMIILALLCFLFLHWRSKQQDYAC